MLFVGIDGGGTKTDAVLCDETGRVIQRVKGAPSSPTSQTPEKAVENLRDVMSYLMMRHGGLSGHIDSLFAGLSGGGVGKNVALMRGYLMEMLPGCKRVDNFNDAINALRTVIPDGDALSAIAGTGSSVFACSGDQLYQVGGWGYLLGDEGSGYDLGRRALMCALRYLDGRGPATSLTEACRVQLGMEVTKAIPELYAGSRTYIADFCTVLLREAGKGDALAIEQMHEAARSLAESIITAGKRISVSPKPVALAGSVWRNPLYKEAVQQYLGDDYVLRDSNLPPVYGSYVIAMKNAGISVTKDIEDTFRMTLTQPTEIA